MAGIEPECTTSIPLASTTAHGWRASTASAGDLAAAERLAPEWEALVERTGCNRVFCAPSWYLAVCRAEPSLTPYVVSVRRDGLLVGVLPLVFDETQLRFATRYADYNDLIAADDEAAALALGHALEEGLPLVLERVLAGGRAYAASRAFELPMEPDREMSFINFRDGYDAYLATRSRNFRWNLGQARRRAAAAGCHATELTPLGFAPSMLPDVFLGLHFQRIPESVLSDEAPIAFVREALPPMFAEGKLRAFAVLRGERVVAIDLCTTGNDSLGLWNGGFDNEFAAISPGRLLLDFCSRLLCSGGIGEFDLLRGDYPYKRQWRTGVRTTWTFTR